MVTQRIVPELLLLALVAAPVAGADDTGTHEKIEALERQQQRFSEELKTLRESIEKPAARPKRVEEVERRQGIMTEELRRLRESLVLPETKELKSAYGLGPAASKVYTIERGLSIGGYGETSFKNVISDRAGAHDEFDFLRFVLYFGYKYNEWIVFNSEIEFEHATSGSTASAGNGSVSVELATIDFLFHPRANARVGMLLVPVGFVNEIHEPPFFHGNVRPQVEQQIIPSTWRANGFGFFGELFPGVEYRTYGITSFNAKGFGKSNLRGGRQKGNREKADDWSWVARLDYSPAPEVKIGGSVYLGDQGQNQVFGNPEEPATLERADVFMQLYEAHAQVRTRGLELRALAAYVDIDDADVLSIDPEVKGPVAEILLGAYGEVAYDIMAHIMPETTQYLAPWFRYSWLDSQNKVPAGFSADRTQRREVYELGVSYKPIPQVVVKLDYRIQDRDGGAAPDELRIGAGYVF